MADNDQPTTPESNARAYAHNLGRAVKNDLDRLTDEGDVPGTGIGLMDKLKLAGLAKQLGDPCITELAKGNNCTGDFNLTAGKSLSYKVSFEQGAEFKIQGANGQVRQVRYKPTMPGGVR